MIFYHSITSVFCSAACAADGFSPRRAAGAQPGQAGPSVDPAPSQEAEGEGLTLIDVSGAGFKKVCKAEALFLWIKAQARKNRSFSPDNPYPLEGFALRDCHERLAAAGDDPDDPAAWEGLDIPVADFRAACLTAARRVAQHILSRAYVHEAGDQAVWTDLYQDLVALGGESVHNEDLLKSHGFAGRGDFQRIVRESHLQSVKQMFRESLEPGTDTFFACLSMDMAGEALEASGFHPEGAEVYARIGTDRGFFAQRLALARQRLEAYAGIADIGDEEITALEPLPAALSLTPGGVS